MYIYFTASYFMYVIAKYFYDIKNVKIVKYHDIYPGYKLECLLINNTNI